LLGAYTTFSALCKETAVLLMGGNYMFAFTYMGLSIGLGLLAAFAGIVSARKIIALLSGDQSGKNKPEIFDDREVL
jgi:CrcB protein